jgi:DNA sulfur modification protein DndE
MKPPVETFHISQRARDILIKLKRKTGIEHWNVLCRWALCESLRTPSVPVPSASPESNVEMTWKTFGGSIADALSAAIACRAHTDGVTQDHESLAAYFRNHLERGISQLQAVKDLSDLAARSIAPETTPRADPPAAML